MYIQHVHYNCWTSYESTNDDGNWVEWNHFCTMLQQRLHALEAGECLPSQGVLWYNTCNRIARAKWIHGVVNWLKWFKSYSLWSWYVSKWKLVLSSSLPLSPPLLSLSLSLSLSPSLSLSLCGVSLETQILVLTACTVHMWDRPQEPFGMPTMQLPLQQ